MRKDYAYTYISETKSEYYSLLDAVLTSGRWEEWIIYILKGVQDTADHCLKLLKEINQLIDKTSVKIKENKMDHLELKRNFKQDDKLRAAFIALSVKVFDLDFEPWYQSGAWDHTYEPFTYFDGDKAVANVSVSHMTLMIDGQKVQGLQVGTVMTDPEYRRRGLAKALFQEIFKVYPPSQYQYFLAADDEAVPLYQLMGFEHWSEVCFEVTLTQTLETMVGAQSDLQPLPIIQGPQVALSAQAFVALKRDKPLSDAALQVIHDDSILKFYYVMGFSDMMYQVMNAEGEALGYALLEAHGTVLMVYDLYQNLNEIQLAQVAKAWGFTHLRLMYTPSKTIVEALNSASYALCTTTDLKSQWMVHQGYGNDLAPMPKWPSMARFPKLSQT